MKRRAFSRNDSEEIIAHISEKKHTSLKVDGNRCFKLKIQQKEKKGSEKNENEHMQAHIPQV